MVQQLKRNSIAAFVMISLILIGNLLIIGVLVNAQKKMSSIVNTAGKQRMYSQRISSLAQQYYYDNDKSAEGEIRNILQEMRQNHNFVTRMHSPQIDAVLYGPEYDYERKFGRFIATAEHFLETRDPALLAGVKQRGENVLEAADRIVSLIEAQYDEDIRTLIAVVAVLLIVSLMILYLMYRKLIRDSLRDTARVYQALHDSEAKIRAITDNTKAIIFIKDLQGHYLFSNRSHAQLLGLQPDDIVGKTDADLFGEEAASEYRENDLRVIESGQPVSYTETLSQNSRNFFFTSEKFLLRDSEGDVYGLCGISTDITFQMELTEQLKEAQTQLSQSQKEARLGTWTMDIQSRELKFSSNAWELLGMDRAEEYFMLDDLLVMMCAKDTEKMLRLFEDALEYGIGFKSEFHIKQGAKMRVFSIVAEAHRNAGEVADLYGSMQDITEMADTRDSMREYVNLVDENIITSKTDKEGIITYTSQAFSDISGYTKEELIGSPQNIVRHPDMPKEVFRELWQTIDRGETWSGEIKNKTKDGGAYWVYATISPTFNYQGEINGYMAIRQDITDKKRIEELSITDALTSLYNRRHFNDTAPKEILRARREHKYLAFILLDIDHFKKYNDSYGHQAGDEVLVSVSQALKESFKRSNDFVFRLGGEEFGVIISEEEPELLARSAENAREHIERLAIEHLLNAPSHVVTASFGMVIVPSTAEDVFVADLYKMADSELYRGKEEGRNRVCIQEL